MKKLAVIGASCFQNPLILKAQERGCQAHVFAWQAGDVGESSADVFYPLSITECDRISSECRRLGIDGVASIGSDLANITVAHVAADMGLVSNSLECVACTTDKHLMRCVFDEHGCPSPKSVRVLPGEPLNAGAFEYPVIVKPTDRSGSRGVFKVSNPAELPRAVEVARSESFGDAVVVEEFVEGREFSVEYISWQGEHRFLGITEKFTTGAPRFIERGHLHPARITAAEASQIREVVEHALCALGVEYGASHSEVKITPEGRVFLIEVGSRMGGDCIGSDLVPLACGYDFVGAVVDVALGREPASAPVGAGPDTPSCAAHPRPAAIRFVFSQEDLDVLAKLKEQAPELLEYESPMDPFGDHSVTDSASRYGYFIFSGETYSQIVPYLPEA